MYRFLGILVAASAIALLAWPVTASAQEVKREGLNELAVELATSTRAVAKKLEQPAVRIGFFTPFGIDDGNAGGALMAALALALGNFVKADAALELQGSYGFVADSSVGTGVKTIVVRAKLIRVGTGQEEKEFSAFEGHVRAIADIARILGPNVALPPQGNYDERMKELQKGLPPGPGKPPEAQAFIHGPGNTLVSAKKGSEYAVEIRTRLLKDGDRRDAAPRKVELLNGLPFVGIDPGELYEVRVLNYSKAEIAVALCIDGIDQFTFSEDRKDDKKDGPPRFTHWIVAPATGDKAGEVVIKGWHKTASPKRQDNVLSFLVTEYGKGAASLFPTKSQGKVGMIEVAIAASHPPGSKGGAETGFGPPVRVEQEVVKRDISSPHEFVTIRYTR